MSILTFHNYCQHQKSTFYFYYKMFSKNGSTLSIIFIVFINSLLIAMFVIFFITISNITIWNSKFHNVSFKNETRENFLELFERVQYLENKTLELQNSTLRIENDFYKNWNFTELIMFCNNQTYYCNNSTDNNTTTPWTPPSENIAFNDLLIRHICVAINKLKFTKLYHHNVTDALTKLRQAFRSEHPTVLESFGEDSELNYVPSCQ